MTLKEAISVRHSRRSYTEQPLPQDVIDALNTIILQANIEDGLHIQLITNEPKAFGSFMKTYGLFSGVHSYLAMVGPQEDTKVQEKLGYYGELLVLTAQTLGLSSCWVGASYDRNSCKADISSGEKLYCLITLGYAKEKAGFTERLAKSFISKPNRTAGQHMANEGNIPLPPWFMQGMDAVLKAPSAMNKLPVRFIFTNGIVTAQTTTQTGYEFIDLGIAKLHFEIGADYIFYDLRTLH